MAELSATGALIGLAVGITTVPLAAALVASPPVSSGASAPTRVRATNSSWQPTAVTVAACTLTGLRVGLHWELPAMLVFTFGLGVLAMSDVYWRALPKRIVYATWAGGLAGLALAAGLEDRWSDFVTSAVTGVAFFVVLAALHLAVPSSLAFGDARVAGPVGTSLGWWGAATVLLGFVVGFVLAGLVSLALMGAGRLDRRASVPLGAFLAAGAAVTIWGFH